MADKILNIIVQYTAQAARQQSAAFHAAEDAAIKKNADTQEKSDQAYIRAIKLKERAFKDFAKEIEQRQKERIAAERQEDQEYARAARGRAKVKRDALNEQKADEKDHQRFFSQLLRDETTKAKASYNEQAKAAVDARRAEMQGMREKHQLAMMEWGLEQKALQQQQAEGNKTSAVIGGYVKSFVGLAGVTMAVRNVADRMKDVSEFTRNAANEFIRLRGSMQEVAALKNRPNNADFTLSEVNKAKAANLTPEEWRTFQAGFQSYAGAQLEGPGAKLNAQQAEDYQAQIAHFMKAEGVDPRLGAELGGTLLEQSKGPRNVKDLMGEYAKTYEVLKKSRTPVQQLLPQVSRITAYDVSPEEAAKLLSVIAPAMPGEEQTGIENTFKAIRELETGGKSGQVGIKEGMSQYEKVKALAKYVNDQKADGAKMNDLYKDLKINDMREFRGVQGLAKQGFEMGGFERYEKFADDLKPAHADEVIKNFDKSEAGQQSQRDADLAAANAQTGARNRKIAEYRQRAEIELTNEKRFERTEARDYLRGAAGWVGAPTVKEQLINERAVDMARKDAGRPVADWNQLPAGAWNSTADEMINNFSKEYEQKNPRPQLPGGMQAQPARQPAAAAAAGANAVPGKQANAAEMDVNAFNQASERMLKVAHIMEEANRPKGPPPPMPGAPTHWNAWRMG